MKKRQLITLGLASIMAMGVYTLPVQADENKGPPKEQAGEYKHGKHKDWHKRWESMTPEEREEHKAKREAMREKMKNMTPEEKKAFWKQRKEEKPANMTPEQRKAYEERRVEMKKKFESMTPEEREAFRKEHHRKWKEKQGEGV